MRITVLTENTACSPLVKAEHGLSLYIETGAHRILFDMGQSDLLLQNARALGVDLSQVDLSVLSHGHYDHGGGLSAFFTVNEKAPVYVNRSAFEKHYRKDGTYIGLDPALQTCKRLVLTEECYEIDGTLSLFACNLRQKPYGLDTAGLLMERDGEAVPEDFRHEQYLLVREGERRILISGCSHKGILNVAHWFAPDVLIGGFHLNKNDPETPRGKAVLDDITARLSAGNTACYTCHCTGVPQYEYLKTKMGDRLGYLACGATVEI